MLPSTVLTIGDGGCTVYAKPSGGEALLPWRPAVLFHTATRVTYTGSCT